MFPWPPSQLLLLHVVMLSRASILAAPGTAERTPTESQSYQLEIGVLQCYQQSVYYWVYELRNCIC